MLLVSHILFACLRSPVYKLSAWPVVDDRVSSIAVLNNLKGVITLGRLTEKDFDSVVSFVSRGTMKSVFSEFSWGCGQ